MVRRLLCCSLVLILGVSAWAAGQALESLKPRELFYSKPNPNRPPAASGQQKSATPGGAPKAQPAVNPGNLPRAEFIRESSTNAVLVNAEFIPLGLRYSLLKKVGNRFDEVDVDTSFRSGDGIRISVEPYDDAYMYLVNKGSSGSWSVLFPSNEID